MVWDNVYPAPSVDGVQAGICAPFGTMKNIVRNGAWGAAAARRPTGSIASSSGKLTAVPKPRKIVRRDIG